MKSREKRTMPEKKYRDIAEIFSDDPAIEKALKEAVRQALLQHKQAGNPVAAWRNGKVVWIPPEEIEVGLGHEEGGGWPAGYFERVAGGWRGETPQRPSQGGFEKREQL